MSLPRRIRCILAFAFVVAVSPRSFAQAPQFDDPKTYTPTDGQYGAIRSRLDDLKAKRKTASGQGGRDLSADVAIFEKAAEWVIRHGEFYNAKYVQYTLDALDRGIERAVQSEAGDHPWAAAKGSVARGYVSRIDGSVQPYAVSVPDAMPESGRYRLDVILHGRNGELNEVRFLHDHDGKPHPKDEPGVLLHVFGRGNNAYRWAGEADVFEAMDAVRRNYPIDEKRILLRGFSMGGAGAWHLGLHHPTSWCAVEAGAGFTDTKGYLGRDDFNDVENKTIAICDAVDVAENAFDVPIAGYGGEKDKQLQASVNIVKALEKLGVPMKTESRVTRAEGLDFLHVVGADVAHSIDPASAEILKEFRDEKALKGRDPEPKSIRFVTYSLRSHRAGWLSIEQMVEQYQPARIEATKDGETAEVKTRNIAVLGVDRDVAETVVLDGDRLPLRSAVKGLLPEVYYRRVEEHWETLDYDASRALQENVRIAKQPGLQGPIDDAFTGPFLCVRGAAQAWNPRVREWTDDRLKQFAELWSKSMRADLPVKDDSDVTQEDIDRFHLILFGDPGSNLLIQQLMPQLPFTWTRQSIHMGKDYASPEHVPVLITINPRNHSRYVVLNSGHTFGKEDFAGTNALLYPRLGDFAVFRTSGEVVTSGFLDEYWRSK